MNKEGFGAYRNIFPKTSKGAETVLLADDNSDVRNIIRDILGMAGYIVIEAVDGKDGIERFVQHQDEIALLVLDMVMPGKNGREAYEEIRKIKPGIKVLFISGYARDVILDEWAYHDVMVEYLPKPFFPKELLHKIRKILDT